MSECLDVVGGNKMDILSEGGEEVILEAIGDDGFQASKSFEKSDGESIVGRAIDDNITKVINDREFLRGQFWYPAD